MFQLPMEEIRQQEYFPNIPPAKPQQTHQENEDAEDLQNSLMSFNKMYIILFSGFKSNE